MEVWGCVCHGALCVLQVVTGVSSVCFVTTVAILLSHVGIFVQYLFNIGTCHTLLGECGSWAPSLTPHSLIIEFCECFFNRSVWCSLHVLPCWLSPCVCPKGAASFSPAVNLCCLFSCWTWMSVICVVVVCNSLMLLWMRLSFLVANVDLRCLVGGCVSSCFLLVVGPFMWDDVPHPCLRSSYVRRYVWNVLLCCVDETLSCTLCSCDRGSLFLIFCLVCYLYCILCVTS